MNNFKILKENTMEIKNIILPKTDPDKVFEKRRNKL
jgi:hypothetical protein